MYNLVACQSLEARLFFLMLSSIYSKSNIPVTHRMKQIRQLTRRMHTRHNKNVIFLCVKQHSRGQTCAFFGCIRKIVKSYFYLFQVCPTVRTEKLGSTGRIFVKFYIQVFIDNLSGKSSRIKI